MTMTINGQYDLSLSELISSLTVALDMTEGQPKEHSLRCCWIGMHIGQKLNLIEQDMHDLFFTLLLKDAGCSSNAARICELYMTDDLNFKKDYKTVGQSLSSVINFVVTHAGKGNKWRHRITTAIDILKNGDQYAQELIHTRCSSGADVAIELGFRQQVADGIYNLDEHWDGTGKPNQLSGESIPLFARIALIAQVFDVFQIEQGLIASSDELLLRSGTWLDPTLVELARPLANDPNFIQVLQSDSVFDAVLSLAPAQATVTVDDVYFDNIAAAFGKIIDAKSPFTAGHSERVAVFSMLIAEELGISEQECIWIKRAALLHDVGKLGVSNTILDKPGKLDDEEWAQVQMHATFTYDILKEIKSLQSFAAMTAAHHEKLDGSGYPRHLKGDEISLLTRIITTADIFDAITAERPYRAAIPVDKTLEIMADSVGTALDPRCFDALKVALTKLPPEYTQQLGTDELPDSPII